MMFARPFVFKRGTLGKRPLLAGKGDVRNKGPFVPAVLSGLVARSLSLDSL